MTTLLLGIPSFRRPAELRALLASIAVQRLPDGVDLAIVVADNDPRDQEARAIVASLAGFPWPLAAVLVEHPGIDATRNRILDEARARGVDLVAMIDDDETAPPDWLAALVACWREHRADVVGGPVRYRPAVPGPGGLATSGAYRIRRHPDGPIPPFQSSANMLLDCATLARLGWPRFDLDFGLTGGGDKEYFIRLAAAGARFAWSNAAVIDEIVPAARLTVAALLHRAYAIGGSDYRIARRHDGPRAALAHLGRSVALLAAVPLLTPALVHPASRLWLLRRFARAAGRLAAARGRRFAYYGASVSP